MAASATSGDAMAGLKAAPQETIADLCAALGDVEQLSGQISRLKAETMQKEAQVLAEIIRRVTPLVAIIGRGGESYYRRDIIILTKHEDCPLFIDRPTRFFSEHKLVLYENGALFQMHRFGETSRGDEARPGWVMNEESELSAEAAISAFGLSVIAEGFIKAFQEAHQTIILKEELGRRLSALTNVPEALQ